MENLSAIYHWMPLFQWRPIFATSLCITASNHHDHHHYHHHYHHIMIKASSSQHHHYHHHYHSIKAYSSHHLRRKLFLLLIAQLNLFAFKISIRQIQTNIKDIAGQSATIMIMVIVTIIAILFCPLIPFQQALVYLEVVLFDVAVGEAGRDQGVLLLFFK